MSKITPEGLREAIGAYKDCVSIIEISKWMGVSRQALWKAMRKAGVETRKGHATYRKIVCDNCGKKYKVTRSRYRKLGKKKFCSDVCYYMYLGNEDSYHNRHKQRIARNKVSEVFDLKPEHVVHHKDGNHWNTDMSNFLVFSSQSDHIKYHHQLRHGSVDVEPIWDGQRNVEKSKVAKKVEEQAAKTVVNPSIKEIKNIEEPPKRGVSLPTSFFNPRPKGDDK